jgi:phosphohistidine phosphatase
MFVLLVRHGPAGDRDPSRWPNDDERPLTERGVKRTRIAARGLVGLVPEVHFLVTSPLRRAHETADLLREVWPDAALETLAALKPRGSTHGVLDHLAGHPPDSVVALVGHEPELGKLAGTLVFGAPAPLPLKKAGACAVTFEDGVARGGGTLLWHLPPRLLRRLARRRERV